MKNIHLLPTDKYSDLVYSTNKYGGYFLSRHYSPMREIGDSYQNIYITNDEEIKEGDWVLGDFPDKPIGKVISKYGEEFTAQSLNGDKYGLAQYDSKKIILTTDQDLIKYGVQAIDDEFLEWFVKNPNCEEVEVESWQTKGEWDIDYKIIIPKDEAKQRAKNYMSLKGALEHKQIKCYCGHTSYCDCGPLDESKQETIEEIRKYAELSYYNGDEINAFIAGAKWQQARMYSEEDMFEFSQWISHEDWVYLPSKGYWVNEE
jgi:hypothetical protein